MTCYCNATWKKNPEYYQHVSTAVYNVTPDKDYAYYPLGLVAGVFALPFFATVIAFFITIRKRLHNCRSPTNNPNTDNPRNDRISFAGPERVSLLASDPPDGHVPCSSTLPTSDNSRNATAELPTASSDTESVQMDVHPSETSPSRRQSQPSLAATEEVLDTDVVYGNIPKEVQPQQKPSPCSEDSEQPFAGEELDTDAVYSTISKATGSGTQRSLLAATAEGLDTDAVYDNTPKEVHPPQKPSPCSEDSEQPSAGEELDTDAVYSTISKATGSGTQRRLLAATAEGLDTDAVYGNIPKEVHPPQKPSPHREESEQPLASEDLNTDAVYSTISKATDSGTQRSLLANTAEGLDTDAVYGNIPKEVHPPQKPSPCREETEQPFAGEEQDTDAVYSTISNDTGSGTQRSLLANTAEALDTDAVYGNIPKEVHPPQKPSPCREETEQPFAGEEQDTDAVYSTISNDTGSGTQRSLLVGERSESEGSRLGEDRGEDHKEHAELSDESTTAASASCLETKAKEQAADEEVYNALSYARHNTLSASDVYDRICFDQANNKQENTPRRKSHE
ncbi:uncharacterized protein [Littorina saxatilis]|uniref:uncharacterized protein n=1 Tax=Littorina saxatilis TaxID=31220 RepID=UPI0038B4AC75